MACIPLAQKQHLRYFNNNPDSSWPSWEFPCYIAILPLYEKKHGGSIKRLFIGKNGSVNMHWNPISQNNIYIYIWTKQTPSLIGLTDPGVPPCSFCCLFVWFHFTMRPKQNDRHFADDIFKCIFLNICISLRISLKLVPNVTIFQHWFR